LTSTKEKNICLQQKIPWLHSRIFIMSPIRRK